MTGVTGRQIIDRARALVAEGKMADARKLLLEEGFIRRHDRDIEQAYPSVIPPSPELVARMKGTLAEIAASEPRRRLQALGDLLRQVFGEWSVDLNAWIADPRATAVLIDAARDPDPEIAEKAAGVLSMVISRYLADIRAFPVLVPLLTSRRKLTRVYSAYGAGYLLHPDRWAALLPLFRDKTADVRRTATRVAVFNAANSEMSRDVRTALTAELRRLQADEDAETRSMAETALEKLAADDAAKPSSGDTPGRKRKS